MRIEGIDHLVLTVRDIAATCDFYSRVLGMEMVTFGAGRKALQFGRQKINLIEVSNYPDGRRRLTVRRPRFARLQGRR